MPELPEVETIKNQIQKKLPIKISKVEKSQVSNSIIKQIDYPLKNLKIEKIKRIGKVLEFSFNDEQYLISGLGMSGSWRVSKEKINEKHTHIQFSGTNKNGKIYLGYIDPRRFGKSYFLTKSNKLKWLERLGADVSTKEFNLNYLLNLKKTKPEKIIKSFLLDQKYFAGVGNYMASEFCAHAGILPTRKMKSLSTNDLKKLLNAVEIVLKGSIEYGGTTFSGGYQDANGDKGEGVKNLRVFYQEYCQNCKVTKVKKITLAQRGTYFCPKCQK